MALFNKISKAEAATLCGQLRDLTGFSWKYEPTDVTLKSKKHYGGMAFTCHAYGTNHIGEEKAEAVGIFHILRRAGIVDSNHLMAMADSDGDRVVIVAAPARVQDYSEKKRLKDQEHVRAFADTIPDHPFPTTLPTDAAPEARALSDEQATIHSILSRMIQHESIEDHPAIWEVDKDTGSFRVELDDATSLSERLTTLGIQHHRSNFGRFQAVIIDASPELLHHLTVRPSTWLERREEAAKAPSPAPARS